MSAQLTDFLALPRSELSQAMPGDEALYFVIDTVLQPDAARRLYGIGGAIEARRLFLGTVFESLAEYSPLWIKVEADSDVADLARDLCVSARAGIAVGIATTEAAAFKHAQGLLRMRSAGAGDALARFYDPLFWSALSLTASGSQRAALFGPWRRVWTSAEPGDEATWITWEHSVNSTAAPTAAFPLSVSSEALGTHEDLRWYYWLCEQREAMPHTLLPESLPLIIDNLRLLASHGIQDGRHLQRLLPQLDRVPLTQQEGSMAVLNSSLPSYQKVQRLEGTKA